MIFTGVGSRETPADVLHFMTKVGFALGYIGWVLRSGGAEGADSAFEDGANRSRGSSEIVIPWNGFNGRRDDPFIIIPETDHRYSKTAREIHPRFDSLSQGAQKLHARNVRQVINYDSGVLTDILICWTPNGAITGGTATAIKLAQKYKVPVINLFGHKLILDDLMREIYRLTLK